MNLRTDLALECTERVSGDLKGIKKSERRTNNTKTTVIEILDENGEKLTGKKKGKYITLERLSFINSAVNDDGFFEFVRCIKELLPPLDGTVLVTGVGNPDITSDALGHLFCSKIFSTRHIDGKMKKEAGFTGKLTSVAAVSADVLGKTGIESSEFIKYTSDGIKPCCIITVDALASLDIKRLGTTVQLCNTGISPGSGVDNKRKEISEKTIGVPVIAIGVPTVVSAFTLAKNICGEIELIEEKEYADGADMIVTPKDIDLIVKNAAYFLSLAVNCALQPDLSYEDIVNIIS